MIKEFFYVTKTTKYIVVQTSLTCCSRDRITPRLLYLKKERAVWKLRNPFQNRYVDVRVHKYYYGTYDGTLFILVLSWKPPRVFMTLFTLHNTQVFISGIARDRKTLRRVVSCLANTETKSEKMKRGWRILTLKQILLLMLLSLPFQGYFFFNTLNRWYFVRFSLFVILSPCQPYSFHFRRV